MRRGVFKKLDKICLLVWDFWLQARLAKGLAAVNAWLSAGMQKAALRQGRGR